MYVHVSKIYFLLGEANQVTIQNLNSTIYEVWNQFAA